MSATTLFIYGSLLSGEANHDNLDGARALGAASTAARYSLIDLGPYPALLKSGETSIVGELYEVTAEHVARLDEFEGAPGLYQRLPIVLADGRRAQAFFFAEEPLNSVLVPSGNWRHHRSTRG